MEALRFCFLTTFYPPHNFGGDGIGIQRLARGLVRRGHHVTVVHDEDAYASLSKTAPPSASEEEPEALVRIGLRSRLGIVSNLLTQQLGKPVVHGARIARILEEGRFDVVNFHNVSLIGGPGLLSQGGDAVRLYMAHEHWLVCPMHVLWKNGEERCESKECVRCAISYRRPPQLYRWSGWFERQLAQVDTFIAMSEFSRDKHYELGFPHHMEVVPYFLPDPEPITETLRPSKSPHRRPYFLFVGRLERIKGLDDVIPIFRDYPEADLLIAGEGEYRSTLEALARGVDRVKFLGHLSSEELARHYEHAVALIVPSVCFETFGTVLIEAFRNRTPVIARRLGPFPEIVERSGGGELFETPEELVQAMRRLQTEPGHRDQLGQAGNRAFRERWVESAVIPRYLEVVRRTAERKGRVSR